MHIITLTTDFGLQDAYVAAMKGVIWDVNGSAVIVDVCHTIEPQNIRQAAFTLSTVYGYFPAGAIHIVVVDPEVGSQRRAIILQTGQALFVAPDNGVLSYVVHDALRKGDVPREAGLIALPRGLTAVDIANPKFWHHPVSPTFHGRDIFAPVAAHLSLGVPLAQFGEPVTAVNVFPLPRPHRGPGGELVGQVLHIDIFGNIVTDVRQEDLPSGGFRVHIAGQQIESLTTAYAGAEVDQLLALIGSSGYLEIAVRNGSAAALLGAKPGDEVRIRTG